MDKLHTIIEHDVVFVLRDCKIEGVRLQSGKRGTVVSIYDGGTAFEVEFDNGTVVTMPADNVQRVWSIEDNAPVS